MKTRIIKTTVIIVLLLVIGVTLSAQNKIPYSIRGSITNSSSSNIFEGIFSNKTQKSVESFTIVFFVFDQDGNSPLRGRNNVVLKISQDVPAGTDYFFSENLDSFFYSTAGYFDSEDSGGFEDEQKYECEYLYVSRISYSDGSQWSDPFGFEYF